MCNGRLSKGALIMINLAFATRKSKFRQKIVLLKSFRQAWPTQHLPSCVSKSKKNTWSSWTPKENKHTTPYWSPKIKLTDDKNNKSDDYSQGEQRHQRPFISRYHHSEENFIPLKSIELEICFTSWLFPESVRKAGELLLIGLDTNLVIQLENTLPPPPIFHPSIPKSKSISRVTQIITHIHYLAFWHNCPGSTDS